MGDAFILGVITARPKIAKSDFPSPIATECHVAIFIAAFLAVHTLGLLAPLACGITDQRAALCKNRIAIVLADLYVAVKAALLSVTAAQLDALAILTHLIGCTTAVGRRPLLSKAQQNAAVEIVASLLSIAASATDGLTLAVVADLFVLTDVATSATVSAIAFNVNALSVATRAVGRTDRRTRR